MFARRFLHNQAFYKPTTPDLLRKRLLYHAQKRGMRENELLLGQFAKNNLHNMSEDEMTQFETILQQLDGDVNLWLTGKQDIPQQLNNSVRKKNSGFFSSLLTEKQVWKRIKQFAESGAINTNEN